MAAAKEIILNAGDNIVIECVDFRFAEKQRMNMRLKKRYASIDEDRSGKIYWEVELIAAKIVANEKNISYAEDYLLKLIIPSETNKEKDLQTI